MDLDNWVIAFFKNIDFKQLNRDSNILIQQSENKCKISVVSVYVDNFLLISNTMVIFDILKKLLTTKYNIKDLNKVKPSLDDK